MTKSGIYRHLFAGEDQSSTPRLQLQSISEAPESPYTTVNFTLTLEEPHLNSRGDLHGAVSGVILDFMGGIAFVADALLQLHTQSKDPLPQSQEDVTQAALTKPRGVSTDMNLSYLRPAKLGDTLEIKAHVKKRGRSLGWIGVEIWTKGKNGKSNLCVEGSHTKYLGK